MDKPDVFMPLYIGDYLAGTSRLTTELHGAYLLLIMDYWMNGPLPDNDAALASITRMTPDAWSIARASLEHFFSIENGSWMHKRVEEELASATEKKRKAREKAKKAASARWDDGNKHASSNAPSIASAKHEECPSPSPSPSYLKEIDIVISYLNDRAGKKFRSVKGNAKHISARLNEGHTVDEMKRVVDRKVSEWKGTSMDEYLRPSTLFNSEKFDGYLNSNAEKPVQQSRHTGLDQIDHSADIKQNVKPGQANF